MIKFLLILFFSLNLFGEIPLTGKKSIEYKRTSYELWLRLAEEYNERSKDNPETKKQIITIFKGFAKNKCELPGFPTEKELAIEAKKVSLKQALDPFAKCILGEALLEGTERTEANFKQAYNLLDQGYTALIKTEYSPFAKFMGSKWLRESLLYTNKVGNKKFQEIKDAYVNCLLTYFSQETEEKEQRLQAYFMMVFMGDRREFLSIEKFYNLFKGDSAKCKPWLKEMTFGSYHAAKSWNFRGAGYARSVTEKGMSGFKKHSKLAGEHFKKAFSLKPSRPESATNLIAISMEGGTNESVRHWFDKAVEAEVDYDPAYSKLLWSYRPRWGGSHQLMISFGKECANTKLYDTLVPSYYLKAVDAIQDETSYETIDRMGLYEQMHEVFKAYGKLESENKLFLHTTKNYYRAWHFCFAVKLNKFGHIKKLYELYGDDLYIKSTFNSFGIKLKHELARAYAMSGQASALISKIHKQLSWNNISQSSINWPTLRQIKDIKKDLQDINSITPEKEAAPYFKYLNKLVDLHYKYYNGEWAELTFSEGLPLWKVFNGNWIVIDEKTILADTNHNEKQYLSSQAMFKPPFVVEVEVESIKSTSRGGNLQAGLIVGRMYRSTGRAFWADAIRKKAGWGKPEDNPNWLKIPSKTNKTKLTVYVWDGYFEMYINDGQENLKREQKDFKSLRVGIGIMPWWKITGQVKYSNFRIKKLGLETPPPKSSVQERVDHYSEQLKDDKKSYLYYNIGLEYYREKQYTKAIDFVLEGDKINPYWWHSMLIALAKDNLHKYQEAVTVYELALKRSRGDSFGKSLIGNNYAYLLATCPDEKIRKPEKALKLSLESLEGEKEGRFYIFGTLACCYAATGDFEKAVLNIDKALKLVKLEEDRKKLLIKKKLFQEKKKFIALP